MWGPPSRVSFTDSTRFLKWRSRSDLEMAIPYPDPDGDGLPLDQPLPSIPPSLDAFGIRLNAFGVWSPTHSVVDDPAWAGWQRALPTRRLPAPETSASDGTRPRLARYELAFDIKLTALVADTAGPNSPQANLRLPRDRRLLSVAASRGLRIS
jgi:hypothetical protein